MKKGVSMVGWKAGTKSLRMMWKGKMLGVRLEELKVRTRTVVVVAAAGPHGNCQRRCEQPALLRRRLESRSR
jgi:hypothetical protein